VAYSEASTPFWYRSPSSLSESARVSPRTSSIRPNRTVPSLELAFDLAARFDCRIEGLFDPEPESRSGCPARRIRVPDSLRRP